MFFFFWFNFCLHFFGNDLFINCRNLRHPLLSKPLKINSPIKAPDSLTSKLLNSKANVTVKEILDNCNTVHEKKYERNFGGLVGAFIQPDQESYQKALYYLDKIDILFPNLYFFRYNFFIG